MQDYEIIQWGIEHLQIIGFENPPHVKIKLVTWL